MALGESARLPADYVSSVLALRFGDSAARSAPKPSFASQSVRRALLIPQANPRSLYRCGENA